MTAIPVTIGSLDTQIGRLSVAVSTAGLLAVGWGGQAELADLVDRRSRAVPTGSTGSTGHGAAGASNHTDASGETTLGEVLRQLAEYFGGERQDFDLVLDWSLVGGRSARAVLQTLWHTVPYGRQITYGALAARSDSAVPARGVGAIMGGNPIPIVVPCHRVVAASGLGGFSGGDRSAEAPDAERPGSSPYGMQTKHWLLTFEGTLPPTLGWDPTARLDLDAIGQLSGGRTAARSR